MHVHVGKWRQINAWHDCCATPVSMPTCRRDSVSCCAGCIASCLMYIRSLLILRVSLFKLNTCGCLCWYSCTALMLSSSSCSMSCRGWQQVICRTHANCVMQPCHSDNSQCLLSQLETDNSSSYCALTCQMFGSQHDTWSGNGAAGKQAVERARACMQLFGYIEQ
jgi:hypothetical protein